MKLDKVKDNVRGFLELYPEARDNDDYLYLLFCMDAGCDNTTVWDFLNNRTEYGVPGFESVRRSRQKVQEEHPELKGTRTAARAKAEDDFRAFALDEKTF